MNQPREPEEPGGGEDTAPRPREGTRPAQGQGAGDAGTEAGDAGTKAGDAEPPQETTAVPRPGVPMSEPEWLAAKKAAERPDPRPDN